MTSQVELVSFYGEDDPEDRRPVRVSLTQEQQEWFEAKLHGLAVDEKDSGLVAFRFADGSQGPWIGRSWPGLTFLRVVGVPWKEARRRGEEHG